jgi:hypothetical protein
MKTITYIFTISMAFLGIFSCKKNSNLIENKKVKIEKESEYHDITDTNNDDILYLVKFDEPHQADAKGGLQSILAIDNIQHNLLQSNAEYIQTSLPEDALSERLKSIEQECEESEVAWKNFKVVAPVKPVTFKGRRGAVAEFEVDEQVDFLNKTIKKRIKRYVIFVHNDLWNIVVAPATTQLYDDEMKELDKMLQTLQIK